MAAGALAAGTASAVLLAGGGIAGANTPSYTSTCTGTPIGTVSAMVVTTGKLPKTEPIKTKFKLADSTIELTLSGTTLTELSGQTVGGTVTTALAAAGAGATPASQPITYTVPPTMIPKPAPASYTLVGTGSATKYKAAKAGKLKVSTTGTSQTTFTVNGATVGPYSCTSTPASSVITTTTATT